MWLYDLLGIIDEAAGLRILADHFFLAEWFDPSVNSALESLAAEASRHQETIAMGRAALRIRFGEEIFAVATDEFTQRFEQAYGSWTRIFNADYRRDIGQLRGLQRTQGSLGYRDALEAIKTAR